jgi:hypothetical protein
MWIIGLPRENRAAATDLARKVFEETFQQASLKSRSAEHMLKYLTGLHLVGIG